MFGKMGKRESRIYKSTYILRNSDRSSKKLNVVRLSYVNFRRYKKNKKRVKNYLSNFKDFMALFFFQIKKTNDQRVM